MHKEAKERILGEVRNTFSLPPNLSVTEWCEGNLLLTSLQTDTPGKYSTRLTPYSRAVLEDFKDHNVEEATLCWGAQTAKTMTMMAGLCWKLVNSPGPSLWVMPNKDLAGAFSSDRLQPLFEECDDLMERKHPDRHRYKKLSMEFSGAIFTLIGSNSPANLASRPASLLIMDETDKFAESTKKEANALELAEMRTKTFASPKIWKTSTPSIPEAPIWGAFLAGTMHRYFVPCPYCDEFMVLTMNPEKSEMPRLEGKEAKLYWDKKAKGPDGWDYDKVEKSAHYICPHCGEKIFDRHKTLMLRKGKWVQTNPNAEPRCVSRHLPSMYAPWKKASWGRLASGFLKALNSLDGLKGFINGELAEPDTGQYEGGGAGNRKEAIVEEKTELAKSIKILTADKQIDHLWYVIREYIPGGHSRLCKWGRVDTEDDLEEIRKENGVAPDLTGEDSGYEASEVYRECARYGWFAIRGDDRESWPLKVKDKKGRIKTIQVPYNVRMFDPYTGTKYQGRKKIAELRWSNPTVKDILAALRNSEKSAIRWEVPEDLATDEYWRHLDGEYKAREFNRNTGRVRYVWKKRSRHWPNHLLDCEAENLVVAIKVGILKTKEDE